jgi:hypothetical protein
MQERDFTGTDRALGIVTMVYSAACNVCLGGAIVTGGGILAAAGIGASYGSRTAEQSSAATAAVAGASGIMVALGILSIVIGIVGFLGGWLMYKGRKNGFVLVAAVSGLAVLVALASLPGSVLNLLLSGAICVYCVMRLLGKWGDVPTPTGPNP